MLLLMRYMPSELPELVSFGSFGGFFVSAGRRRDSEDEVKSGGGKIEDHAKRFVDGHPLHATRSQGEAAMRELESINKQAASGETLSLQVLHT